ncbi:two-component response regulator [Staphylococcus piscifermentans]|uniref:Sensory transduction protein LytR n=1 Tax=Staphylococcus piscifermentans TaxID=70258 RepID=A0A239TNZ2_9STAP|nr:response regulator transcription factor LytR [Staphylococcus piscifermentans]RTX84104.1 DNA-binding response regulator [Staphylococcus piscifermentans]GEP84444.1 sensory transduction protein LytR [Staphylococcus piscifermentans]SNU99159.1 two-component response regulator [Staphylococcus piscifermentans]
MNTLIVDDEPLARNELNYLLTQNGHFETIDEAETIAETLEKLLYETYDVIFLDINLMNESGLDLAEKIQKMKQAPYIIFATAHDNFAVKAFELDATDYILKPFEQSRIDQAVERVAAKLNTASVPGKENAEEQSASEKVGEPVRHHSDRTSDVPIKQPSVLPIEVDERIYVLNQRDIIALSVNNGKTTLHTLSRDYETTEPLNTFAKRLNPTQFLRIHRSTIINQAHIETIEHWFNYTYQVTLTGGLKVQVSRSYMKPFKAAIGLI